MGTLFGALMLFPFALPAITRIANNTEIITLIRRVANYTMQDTAVVKWRVGSCWMRHLKHIDIAKSIPACIAY
jgi:hypothetical protein